jgi:hypothetical protein
MVLNSKWAPNPLSLNENLADAEWAGSNPQKLPIAGNFWLYLRNDAHFMYLAIDMLDETSNNNSSGDYFWLSFDVNKNGSINPNQDINYGIQTATYPGKVVRQYYLGPNTWTGINGQPGNYKFAFEGSPKNSAAHKVWKMKIPLSDFGINLATNVVAWSGLRVNASGHVHDFPAQFSGTGFAQMSTSVFVFARNAAIDPALMGPVIAAVGLIPTAASVIDPATGRATTAAGYYVSAFKSAFGGSLNLIFNHNTVNTVRAAGAVKYKVMYGPSGGSMAELRSAWYNYRWVGNDVVLDAFGPDGGGYYTLPNPAAQYSIEDLLIQFNSALMPNGLYQFTVQFFNAANAPVASPAQTLKLFIDNTVPVVALNLIAKSSAPTFDFAVCEFAKLAPGEGLVFKMTATDPEGDISSYGLNFAYGNGSGGGIYADAFDASKPPGWTGVSNFAVPTSPSPWIPPATCAYAFTVYAYARTTNGYGSIGYNSVSRMITIIKS